MFCIIMCHTTFNLCNPPNFYSALTLQHLRIIMQGLVSDSFHLEAGIGVCGGGGGGGGCHTMVAEVPLFRKFPEIKTFQIERKKNFRKKWNSVARKKKRLIKKGESIWKE